jgi:hypothetical protein
MHFQVATILSPGKGSRFPVGGGPQNGSEHAVAGSANATFQHVSNHFTALIGLVQGKCTEIYCF